MTKSFSCFLLFYLLSFTLTGQKLALLKYSGGGDWYSNPTSLKNLALYCNEKLNTKLDLEHKVLEPQDLDIFEYPYIHMTGHGNVFFSENDMTTLRKYLLSGGFLHIDDNYGMAEYLFPQLKKLFPKLKLVELPHDFIIFQKPFFFAKGLPKIHEHDNKPPQSFGFFHEGRLMLLFTYETDLGDGWEDREVHHNSEVKRIESLKMGANIIWYAFTQN